MRILRRSLVALVLLLMSGPIFAQSLIGSISGAVKDQQGAPLPGVTVTLTGKTGAKTAVSDAAGTYRFGAVDPGAYSLTADLQGFQGRKQENIAISIGQRLDLDFVLAVATVKEEITVTGEAPVVDTTSTETTNAISQDLLFNMPLNRFAPDLLNYAPGINEGSAFGGAATGGGSGIGNALLIDGVDTRDPEGGTAWSFINYNVIDEVQIQGLGAPAEYGSFTGAVMNSITKSGGNQFTGLFDINYSTKSLSSDNRSAEIRSANPTLEPSTTTKFVDFTAQIGGPIIQDKLFFFASAQRYHLTLDPSGPRTIRDELSHRADAKVTYQPSPNDNFMAHLEFDDYSIKGRPGFSSDIDTDAQTVSEDAPEVIWNVQWRHLFGSKTFLEAKYLGWWGYYYTDPVTPGSRFYNVTTNGYDTQPAGTPFAGQPSSSGEYYYADRGRNEAHASLSHYAEAFGRHDMKFGVQIERSKVRSRYGYPTGVNYYDSTAYYPVGQYYAYTYGYDFQARNHRESFYAQDSWKPNDRLTINAGVRYDHVSGNDVNGNKVFGTNSVAPRLGVAWDVTGDHKSVLRASYSQYYEAAFSTLYEKALPGGRQDYVAYCYDGVSQEPGGPPGYSECDRVPFSVPMKVDPNIKHPRVDEYTAAFERAFAGDFRVQVTGIWRENKNVVDSVLPDARWDPVTLKIPNYGTDEQPSALAGQPLNLYTWTNRSDSQANGLITNVNGFQYLDSNGNVIGTANAFRRYKGLMFVLSKRLTHRWQGQLSYVLSKTEGTLDNRSFGANTGAPFSHLWESPNTAIVNANGLVGGDRRHEVKLFAGYQVPKVEVGINAYYRYLDGLPYTPLVRFSGADRRALGLTVVPSALRTILAEPRGSRRLDPWSLLDLRLEKIFKMGRGRDRLAVYADLANVFNKGTVDDVRTRLSPTTLGTETPATPTCPCDVPFEGPLSVVPPRQVTFGARWSF
jgi:outer membrane receptor protein involved in Fe transport